MGFKIFTKYHTSSANDPLVTLQRRGASIAMNAVAYDILGRPPRVELYYDEEIKQILIAAADENSIHSTPVNHVKGSDSHYCAGSAFTRTCHIDTSISRRYKAIVQERNLVIDLKGPCIDATGPMMHRKRKKLSDEAIQQHFFEVPPEEQGGPVSNGEPGNESGRVEGKEQASSLHSPVVDEAAMAIQKLMAQGFSLEEILKRFSPGSNAP